MSFFHADLLVIKDAQGLNSKERIRNGPSASVLVLITFELVESGSFRSIICLTQRHNLLHLLAIDPHVYLEFDRNYSM